MTAPPRTIPVCPVCHSDLQTELDGFWCAACHAHVPFPDAEPVEGDDDDD